MSRITFSTRQDEAELRGPERYHMDFITRNIFEGLLTDKIEELEKIVDCNHMKLYFDDYNTLCRQKDFRAVGNLDRYINNHIRIAISVGSGTKLNLYNKSGESIKVDPWHVVLNTALIYGSDIVKLAAYLHARCEIHLWVAGENRAWMADIIEDGLEKKIFRPNLGWDGVIALLRKSKRGAVVTEYSVTDCFHWKDGLNPDLELTPDRLRNELFGDGYTVNDLHAYARSRQRSPCQMPRYE